MRSSRIRLAQLSILVTIAVSLFSIKELSPQLLLHPQSAADTTTTTTTSASAAIHYHWHPDGFVGIISDCIFDDGCGILYHHVMKTGGTTLEKIFFRLLPPNITDTELAFAIKRTDPARIRQFDRHRHAYCVQSKFSSYQTNFSKFKEITNACIEVSKTKRYVALATYREPIGRTLSMIHQHCNKKFSERPKELQNACTRCRYLDRDDETSSSSSSSSASEVDSDREIWDGYVNETNRIYQELSLMNHHLKEDIGNSNKHHQKTGQPLVDVLMMDMNDLNGFFRGLDDALVVSQRDSAATAAAATNNTLRVPLSRSTTHNEEKLEICDFGLKSKMIKSLKPALKVYRELTLSS